MDYQRHSDYTKWPYHSVLQIVSGSQYVCRQNSPWLPESRKVYAPQVVHWRAPDPNISAPIYRDDIQNWP